MSNYFVTRHPGAREWAARQGIDAQQITHLDINTIKKGDLVMGTLPVSIAADVIERGGRYLHLDLKTPEKDRGRNLTADEMAQWGACLQEYHIVKTGNAAS